MRELEQSVLIGERNDHGGSPEGNRDALGHASLMAGHLLVLASGVGGTGGGRMEGNLAVSTVLTQFRTMADSAVSERLTSALSKGNDLLAARAGQDPSLHGSGASCAAILLQDGALYAARAGDIRLFIIRDDHVAEVFPAEPKASDQALQEDRVHSPSAQVGALGAGFAARILVTANAISLTPGDKIILASPGIHHYLGDADITRLTSNHVPQVAAGRMVDAARESGARQGISVQVLQYGDKTPALSYAPKRHTETFRSEPTSPNYSLGGETAGLASPMEQEVTAPAPPRKIPTEPEVIATQPAQFAATKYSARLDAPQDNSSFDEPMPLRPRTPIMLGLGSANTDGWYVPTAVAAGIALLLWFWAPWATQDPAEADTENTPEIAHLTGDAEEVTADLSARILPGSLPEDDAQAALLADSGNEPIQGDVEPFWLQVNDALESGATITPVVIESWLTEGIGDETEVVEQAKSHLSELTSLRNALEQVASADSEALNDAEAKRLDLIFRNPSAQAAQRLNQFIKNRYELKGDAVFQSLEFYVRTHRTPEVVRAFIHMNSMRPKPGPRTRAWLEDTLPQLLAGM